MSHAATNWAIQQRGLKPTTKIILWHLCDRYNPDYGCFPSQDLLAHDCEVSRSTLNAHLSILETTGLIRRVQRINPATKRQMPTRYILAFEPGFAQDRLPPCPDTGHGKNEPHGSPKTDPESAPESAFDDATEGQKTPNPSPKFAHGAVSDFDPDPCPKNRSFRVQNPDTNPVREPVSKSVKEEEDAQARKILDERFWKALLQALGFDPDGALPGWWQGSSARRHADRWRDELGLSEKEVLDAASQSREDHPAPPDGPKALDRIMQRAAQRKAEDTSRTRRKGRAAPKAKCRSLADLAVFYAEMVNSDKFMPASTISNSMRDAMLAHGLVTQERLRERGVL
ncbi:helix-turn-helix domain-containing protein [Shimia litoralis]|uniref:Helix-turn-helix domain-containing protein n=1 Tax=Shimia litoralis TaxID=420403 RepID=A0A4U7MTF6_9RHOB|nr:helix-turn-helix domain-containing protein [Shimia litoralis]TKZ16036.1 helix-turn-helix domain-containing protein [Shimia litoralis]